MDTREADRLRQAARAELDAGRLVPVMGSGVSTEAAGIPGWRGVVACGLDHAAAVGLGTADEIARLRALLDGPTLIPAAEGMTALLGAPGGEFPLWLRDTFGVERNRIRSRRLLKAISDLMTPLVATTNYDRLLSFVHPDAPLSVTWRQPALMQAALRDGGHVLHLHGVYDDPTSVILGVRDYGHLAASEAYRAVMRSLWLDRTLLFIGCSFDGLRDPDFAALLDWTARAFAGSAYKHYALVRDGEVGYEDARHALLTWRVQVIGYGPHYDDLPGWLDAVNPYHEQAETRLFRRVREMASARDPRDEAALAQLIGDLRRVDAPDIDVGAEVHRLFTQRRHTMARLRGDLIALQRLAQTLIDPGAVQAAILDPRTMGQETVIAATEALLLFPATLLAALKRRGVDVHEMVVVEEGRSLAEHLRLWRRIPNVGLDFEGKQRVVRTLHAVLSANPHTLFPDPRRGQPLSEGGWSLVVVRSDRIEVRSLDAPERRSGVLYWETPGLGSAALAEINNRTAIIAHGREVVLAWDPRTTDAPFAEFLVSDPYGINAVAHLPSPSGLRSIVTTISGNVYQLTNLGRVEQRAVPGPIGSLSDAAFLPDGRLFALSAGDDIVTLAPDGAITTLLARDHVPALLVGRPGVRFDDAAWFWLVNHDLRAVDLAGEAVLALRFALHTQDFRDTVVLFLRPGDESVEVLGHYCVQNRALTGFDISPGDDGAPRLAGALLSDFNLSWDLVVWARGTPTRKGIVFVDEGSTVRTYDDMICMAVRPPDAGFASDDSGGLFAFSLRDRSYREIDRDPHSRIRALRIARW